MDAIKLIREDHEKFRSILKDLEESTERAVKTREKLFEQLRGLLEPHEAMEEEIFYPALREKLKDDDIVLEGYEEHHAADVLLAELESVPYDDESWGPKMKVIQENIEHHMEEEEGPMFSQARKALAKDELEELGLQMEERKSASALR